MSKAERKAQYFEKLLGYLEEFPKVFIVGCDNVGSNQMQKVRIALRGKAEILMGKNTLIRKALRGLAAENPDIAKLMHVVRGNVGFVFTKGDLCEIRDILHSYKVSAPARAGGVAPTDVIVPAGNTGMGPEKTQFFQALNIQTKITKGTVEIVNNVPLIKAGDKVGASEAMLLNMMNISPFAYALVVQYVYDNGSLYEPHVLDIKDSDLLARFMAGVTNVASVSLAIGYPTVAAIPHMVVNGYKNVLAVALATDITFPLAEKAKAFLADPEAALAALAAMAPAAAAPAAGAAAAAPEPEPEPEEEEEEDMGFDLFG